MPFPRTFLNIWDLDNCHYPYNDEFHGACKMAAAKAAINLGAELTLEEALNVAIDSYNTFGESSEKFILDYNIARKNIHELYHSLIDVNFLTPCRETCAELGVNQSVNAILSHGSADWAKKVLGRLHRLEFFPESMIVGLDSLDFKHRKNDGIQAFEYIISCYNQLNCGSIKTNEITMIEDSPKNLVYPKEMGMTTVQVTHGLEVEKCSHVDFYFDSPLDFLKAQNS